MLRFSLSFLDKKRTQNEALPDTTAFIQSSKKMKNKCSSPDKMGCLSTFHAAAVARYDDDGINDNYSACVLWNESKLMDKVPANQQKQRRGILCLYGILVGLLVSLATITLNVCLFHWFFPTNNSFTDISLLKDWPSQSVSTQTNLLWRCFVCSVVSTVVAWIALVNCGLRSAVGFRDDDDGSNKQHQVQVAGVFLKGAVVGVLLTWISMNVDVEPNSGELTGLLLVVVVLILLTGRFWPASAMPEGQKTLENHHFPNATV